ncbi:MAG: DUF1326 domain-containing protein [Thermoanaerobaculia bacterium]
MKKLAFCVILFSTVGIAVSTAQQIQGDYIETRSADVYTGSCFANGEVGLVGNEAILGWRVSKGSWNGVSLEGKSVVAAVKARATLGDPYDDPYPARAVVIVDERASAPQRTALLAFAKQMGGRLLENVNTVIEAPISFDVADHASGRHGAALLRAGRFVTVQTRSVNENDHLCGNEETFYPPLTKTTHAMPAVALTDRFQGPGLGETWNSRDKRSAFVGTFAR